MLLYTYNVRGTVWIILYLFFVLAPLFALLTGSLSPPQASFLPEANSTTRNSLESDIGETPFRIL